MTPKDLIRLRKTVAKPGEWKVVTNNSKMPKSAFPFSKREGLVLGRGWHWRVDQLAAESAKFRLLTAFDPDHQEFRGWLSLQRDEAHIIVGRFEFHGDHEGWHCHVPCCDIHDIEPGAPGPRQSARLPGGMARHRRIDFEVTETSALAKCFEFFRVTASPDGALL